jgi:hypothetical protein
MPAGDRTGPLGAGPMTGRGAGYCGGYSAPGVANWGPGRGMGRGFGGGGYGWRHMFYATGQPSWMRSGAAPLPEQELAVLKAQAEGLKNQLDAINRRIEAMEQK